MVFPWCGVAAPTLSLTRFEFSAGSRCLIFRYLLFLTWRPETCRPAGLGIAGGKVGSAAAEISLGLWTEPTKTKKRYALHKFEDKTLNYYLALVLLGFFVVCLGFFFFFPPWVCEAGAPTWKLEEEAVVIETRRGALAASAGFLGEVTRERPH